VAPAVDLLDKNHEISFRAELPGLDQQDIEVTVDEDILTIRGERLGEAAAEEKYYYSFE
jgi:HSP20 family protein